MWVRARRRHWLYVYASRKGCAHCGINDIRCLEFDHITDDKDVGVMASRGPLYKIGAEGRSLLIKEVRKCQVLCANCHRIKTKESHDYKRTGVACDIQRREAYEQWQESVASLQREAAKCEQDVVSCEDKDKGVSGVSGDDTNVTHDGEQ